MKHLLIVDLNQTSMTYLIGLSIQCESMKKPLNCYNESKTCNTCTEGKPVRQYRNYTFIEK